MSRHAGSFSLALLMVAVSCADPQPPVVARRVTTRAELIGGPKQFGDVGDFLLQNSRIRAVILDAGHAVSPALWGGALADVDRVRTPLQYRNGQGLDQFFLTVPMVNLNIAHPETGDVTAFVSPDGRTGTVRITGRGDRVLALLNLMDLGEMLGLITRFAMRTDYSLDADAQHIRITTIFRPIEEKLCDDHADDDGDGRSDCDDADCSLDPACPDWCGRQQCPQGTACDPFFGGCLARCGEDGACATGECDPGTGLCMARTVAMTDLKAHTDLTDVLTGGLLRLLAGEIAELDRQPGYVAGDMALFGANLFSFAPGLGYEIDAQYRLMFLRGRNALLDPLAFDLLAGTGDRVSYAYFSLDGAVLFPFATESLTGSMTHGLNCLQSDSDDKDCDQVPFVRFSRYLAVGEGDVASVLETVYALRRTPHGRVSGQVIDRKTGLPVSGADVFAVSDPCDPATCAQVPSPCGPFATYDELARAARACTRTPDNPDGTGRIESQFRTDRGMTPHPSGRFEGPLKPGVYYLVARTGKGPLSTPARIPVTEGRTTGASLALPEPGRLRWRVLDERGMPVPARVSVGHCFPECRGTGDCPEGLSCDAEFQCRPARCALDPDCDEDEACSNGKCVCRTEKLPGEPREELGDGYLSDRKVAVAQSISGEGEIALPPGKYDVVFSHGIEFEIDSRSVVLEPGRTAFVDARVTRVVDTRGWLALDQHVHSSGSPDSGTSLDARLTSFLADGIEVAAMTDHDYISDPMPLARGLGLEPRLALFAGEEVTTLDISHLIGFPLRYVEPDSDHGAMDWTGKTPAEVFAWLRAHGADSPDRTVVVIPHPRGGMSSYFDVFGLNPFSLALEPGMVQKATPLLSPANFAQDWDAQEIVNDKRLDIARTPTWSEVRDYNLFQERSLRELKDRPREEVLARMARPSADFVRRFLARTPAEQEAWRAFPGLPRCTLPRNCSTDADCKDGPRCKLPLGACLVACETSAACPDGLPCMDGWCELPLDAPCEAVKGMSDDWMRLIDHGVFKPGVGGSDTHGIANYEMGHLRNFFSGLGDDPRAVDLAGLVSAYREGRGFATFGPFIDLTVDGVGPGGTVAMAGRKSVPLRVRVQSPSWFDVSRVELYRNGRLERVWDADAPDPALRIAVPNDAIVNLEATLDVSPDQDSWYLVYAMGIKGRTLAPVYGSAELPPVYLGDLFSAIFGTLPISLPSYIVSPKIPVYYPQFPFAITNPVFVDVDGPDARGCRITPQSGPLPDWACQYPSGWPKERMPCACR